MARYRVISAFCLGGGRDVYVGDVIELDEYAGRVKIGQGFVVRLPEAPKPPASAAEPMEEPEQPASEAPRGEPAEATHQDPEPTRRGRRG